MVPGSRPPHVPRRRRADAEQNVVAILDAAITVLAEQPEASIDDIAKAAGVSRQTVYAHYASREVLINAAIKRGSTEVKLAFEAAALDDLPPPEALVRLLDIVWETSARYPFVWHAPPVGAQDDLDRHQPMLGLVEALIRRGQATGDFDPRPSPTWLLAASLALTRAAEDEVKARRMTVEQATNQVSHSILRLIATHDTTDRA
jgi:AcrR family transcriptional regulator